MLPKPVYEVLPFVYLTVGVAVLAALDSVLKFIPGLLFSGVGVYLLWQRFAYRRSRSTRERLERIRDRQGKARRRARYEAEQRLKRRQSIYDRES